MKKIFFLIAFLIVTNPFFAQNVAPLTIREAYNFSIGDTFQYVHSYRILNRDLSGYIICKDTIFYSQSIVSNKWYNPKRDTLFHIVNQGFYPPFKLDTAKFSNLDSVVFFKEKTSCKNMAGSAQGYPKSNENSYMKMDFKTTEFNCQGGLDNTKYIFTEGLGNTAIIYSDDTNCNLEFWKRKSELIFFKRGNMTWGTPVILSSDKVIPLVSSRITLSPNPTSDILTLKSDEIFDKVNIINIQGKVVASEGDFKATEKNVSVAGLPNGIYFTQVFKDKILRGVNKFVVNH
jgi:Secretion system C-terminal sorting domain